VILLTAAHHAIFQCSARGAVLALCHGPALSEFICLMLLCSNPAYYVLAGSYIQLLAYYYDYYCSSSSNTLEVVYHLLKLKPDSIVYVTVS